MVKDSLYHQLLSQNHSPLVARILAARLPDNEPLDPLITPQLSYLTPPALLKDMDKAVNRLVQALIQGESIGLETDHDCDGQTAHAVLYTALRSDFHHPENKILSFIGHRLEEGYGLSPALATRILEKRPTLVITADNGSSDEAQIALLKAEGIDVIVTDHHEIPSSGIPPSAHAVINPSRPDCPYPDKAIAGCMVAWLFMTMVRQKLISLGRLPPTAPSLAPLLDFVAVGTVADCVSLASSANNRAVVRYGMRLIAQQIRPCWRAVQPFLSDPFSSEDLGFVIGPLLNSDGRLSDALTSVSFLLAKTDEESEAWVVFLRSQNERRKKIQQTLTQQATLEARVWVEKGYHSICILLEDGHSGVHGISASRLKDIFGRPTVLFSPKQNHPTWITGSARSIDGFHIRQAFEKAAKHITGVIGFGGHKGAAGITLERDALPAFRDAFEAVAAEQLSDWALGPVTWTDGELPFEYHTLSDMTALHAQLEPFGRAFEPPTFEMTGVVQRLQPVGDGTHGRLTLQGAFLITAIWFNLREKSTDPLPVTPGQPVHVAYRVKSRTFQGIKRLEYQVVALMGG